MKIFHKLIMLTVLAVPMTLTAEGVGLYVPFNLYSKSNVTLNPDNVFGGRERGVRADYDPSLGIGLMYDTNVGENKVMNYRAGLEYMSTWVDSVNTIESDRSNKRLDFVNTFGFGLVRSEHLRFWIGPRVNFAWNRGIGGIETASSALEIGIAAAIGANVELSREIVLGLDIDYKVAYVSGDYESDGITGGSFYGNVEGSTARIYMIYMFGETFPKPMSKDVVDNSL